MPRYTPLILVFSLFVSACTLFSPAQPTSTKTPETKAEPTAVPPVVRKYLRVAYVTRAGELFFWDEEIALLKAQNSPDLKAQRENPLRLTTIPGVQLVSISADGKMVAFVADGALYRFDVLKNSSELLIDNTYLRRITATSDDARIINMDYSKEGRILFLKILVNGPYGGLDFYKLEDGATLLSRDLPQNVGSSIFVSPNGACKVISNLSQVDVACGTELRVVESFPLTCQYGQHSGTSIRWVDNSGFYYVAPNCTKDAYLGHVFRYSPRQGKEVETIFEFKGGQYDQVEISPDGKSVACMMDTGTMLDVWFFSKGRAHMLTTQPEAEFAFLGWAPDSKHVVFARKNNLLYDLSYVNSEDGSSTPLLVAQAEGMDMPGVSGSARHFLPQITWLTDQRFLMSGDMSGDTTLWVVSLGHLEYQIASSVFGYDYAYSP